MAARSKVIHIRVTPELHQAIHKKAKKDKRTASDWCSIALGAALESGGAK